jgi:hypothetical protein
MQPSEVPFWHLSRYSLGGHFDEAEMASAAVGWGNAMVSWPNPSAYPQIAVDLPQVNRCGSPTNIAGGKRKVSPTRR